MEKKVVRNEVVSVIIRRRVPVEATVKEKPIRLAFARICHFVEDATPFHPTASESAVRAASKFVSLDLMGLVIFC